MTTLSVNDLTLHAEYNWEDPIYKVLRRETASPRFKVFMMKKAMLNPLFYQYTDMLALRIRGGGDLDDLMRRQRRLLVEEGVVTESNERMQERMQETGRPYEDLEESDFRYGDVWCG